MIDFAQPGYLLLLAVVAAMVVGAWRLNRWRSRARQNFAGPQAGSWPASAFWARTLLLLAAALLVAFAAARPQWGKTERFREREGVDFVIALDISKSMEATDAQPSRLALAQEELVRLVEAERGSRIGLVFFAGNAFLRSPLTSDTQAMVQLIRRANQEIGLTRVGSDLGAALDVAGVILAASEENRGRAVVLVSDGEDHAGSFAAKAAELQAKGIAVHTAGVGTLQGGRLFDRSATGAQIPHLDASGQPVVTRLNDGTLRAIADAGGGNYHLIGSANDTLLDVRVDLRRLDPTPIADERLLIPVERYQFFIGGAIILLLASWFLPARWPGLALARVRRVRPQPGLALLLAAFCVGACGSASDSLRDSNHEANRLYESGDFEGALAAYQELLAQRPDVDELSYNAGNTLHRLDNFERAIAETQRALPPNEVRLGVATYYSLGNHFLYSGRFEEAYVAYRAALLLDSTDQDSKHNLEIALLAMDGEFQPGGPDDQRQGNGTPQPGQGTPQAGEGTPQAGEGTPQAGQGTPDAGGGGAPNPTPGNAQSFQRTLEEALAGIDEELTFEEAIAILDLLRQRQQMPRSGPGSGPAGPDY